MVALSDIVGATARQLEHAVRADKFDRIGGIRLRGHIDHGPDVFRRPLVDGQWRFDVLHVVLVHREDALAVVRHIAGRAAAAPVAELEELVDIRAALGIDVSVAVDIAPAVEVCAGVERHFRVGTHDDHSVRTGRRTVRGGAVLSVGGNRGIDAHSAVYRHLNAARHNQRAERGGCHTGGVAVHRGRGVDGRRGAVGHHEGDAARDDVLYAAARDGLDVGAACRRQEVIEHVGREGDLLQIDENRATAAERCHHRVLPEGIGLAADLEVGGSQVHTFGHDDGEDRIGGVCREAGGGRHRAADTPALELVAGGRRDGGQGDRRTNLRRIGHVAAVLRDRVAADGIAHVGRGRKRDLHARLLLHRDLNAAADRRRGAYRRRGDRELEGRATGDDVALRNTADRDVVVRRSEQRDLKGIRRGVCHSDRRCGRLRRRRGTAADLLGVRGGNGNDPAADGDAAGRAVAGGAV